MRNLLDDEVFTLGLKSKKQFQNLITSFLDLVLQEPEVFEGMLETGHPQMMITKDYTCRPVREWGKNKN